MLVVLVAAPVAAADWPQFRGPARSGVSKETGLPLEWSGTKNLVWKRELPGPGASSPVVFGDRVYVTCYSGYGVDPKAPGTMADLTRHLVCVDAKTGKVLWSDAVQAGADSDPAYGEGKNIALHGYASHTPAADETGVYAYFGSGGAAGYAHDGVKKWGAVRLGAKAKVHNYGSGASPVLHENLLVVGAFTETAGLYEQGETVALDKRTGKEVWREKVGGEWSSPLIADSGGKSELVVATFRGLWLGLNPATGKRLWECQAGVSCGTPVAHGGVLYSLAGDSRAAIKLGGRGDVTRTHRVWQTPGGPRISSPVYHDGHLYWSNDGHVAVCADAKTGKEVYRERLGPGGDCYASPVAAEGRIYYVSRRSGTYVVAAKPEFELLARNKIEDDASVFNGSPAVSGGRLFLRSDKYLYCVGQK